jgi:hypothetical protein
MPTAPENVCSLGNTGSDRRAARTPRLTLSRLRGLLTNLLPSRCNNASMRILVACLAILALGRAAVAADVQLGDHVIAVYDGIGCSDWTSFEALHNTDPRTLKDKLPRGCLIVHGSPPALLVVDAVKEGAAAICVRGDASSAPCVWFSLDKVRTLLSAGQRRL